MNLLSNWFVIALIGMFSFAGMALTLKKLTLSNPTPVILLYMFLFTSFSYLVLNVARKNSLALSWSSLVFLLLAATFAFIGNICDVEALRLAPNAGYAGAVKAGQIIIITFAAYFLFQDQEMTWTGVAGIFLVFGGLVLLAFQNA